MSAKKSVVDVKASVLDAGATLTAAIIAFNVRVRPLLGKFDDIDYEECMDELRISLRVPICRLAKLVVPDIQQKLDEFIIADERDFTVNSATHGNDAEGSNNELIEIKTSRCKKKDKYKCNFNWPLTNVDARSTVKKTKAARHRALLRKIDEKTGNGGYAILRLYDHKGAVIMKDYELSNAFLRGFFSHITFGKCNNFNMGCRRCRTCNEWHRIKTFADISSEMSKDGRVLTDTEWKSLVNARVSANC
jgi:hypothetical protein